MLSRVVWQKFTDVSEVLAASIISTIALMMEAASTFETSVKFYKTIRCNNPEDSHLYDDVCSSELSIKVSLSS
jgi:hypothetical protein